MDRMDPLRLRNYRNKICDFLYQSYRTNSRLCDIAITTSDHVTFQTHRIILATFSQYFLHQFQRKKVPAALPIDVDAKCLDCLLTFMYTGMLKISANDRISLYQAAVLLNMPDVQELLLQGLSSFQDTLNTKTKLSTSPDFTSPEGITLKIKIEEGEISLPGSSTAQEEVPDVMSPFPSVNYESDDNNNGDSDPDFTPKLKSKRKSKTPTKKIKLKISKTERSNKRKQARKVKSTNESEKTKTKKISFADFVARAVKQKCHCGVCGTSYATYTTLKRHMLVKHYSSTPDLYENRLLLKWYQRQSLNRKFLSSHTELSFSQSQAFTKVSCSKCGKCFKTYSLFCAHIRKRHENYSKSRKDMFHSRIAYISRKREMFIKKLKLMKKKNRPAKYTVEKKKAVKQSSSVKCPMCVVHTASLKKLSLHMINEHSVTDEEARDFTGFPRTGSGIPCHCPKCNILFQSRKDLTIHLRNQHTTPVKTDTLTCAECSEKFKSVLQLKNHLKVIHQKSYTGIRESLGQSVHCEVEDCDFSSANLALLNKHMMSQHPEIEHKCPECGYTFHIKSQRDKHYIFKHENRDLNQRHHCSVCQKKFSKPYYLNKHQFMVHGIDHPNIKRYHCEVEGCDYVSVCSTGLKQHMHSKHSNKEKKFQCDHCGMKLRSRLTLKKHINKIHLNIRPHMCHICGMKFGEEPELMAHITNRHTEEKQFQCEYCSYQTSNKCTFKTHLFLIHKVRAQNEKRPEFHCTQCPFVTVLPGRFRVHCNAHNNIRDYVCKFCEKRFLSSGTLREHVQWNHSQTTHACNYCDYTTKTKKKLNEHIRVQHQLKGLKPYSCPYCEFTCATGGNCRKHVMLKHKGQEVRYLRDDNLLMAARIARESGTNVTNLIAQATEAAVQQQPHPLPPTLEPEVPIPEHLQYPVYHNFSQFTGHL